jgi:hypothetical protein
MISRSHTTNERQPSMNALGFCILDNQMAMQGCYPIIRVLAALIGTNAREHIATTS